MGGTTGFTFTGSSAIDVANGMALSVPDFLWGLVLILLFGVLMPLFHISGRVTPSLDLPFTTDFYLFESVLRLRFDLWADIVAHMFMPALALAIGMVLAAEWFNTAVEAVVDLATSERHPLAKTAKDAAAAGVMLTALMAVVVGALLLGIPLWHRLVELVQP